MLTGEAVNIQEAVITLGTQELQWFFESLPLFCVKKQSVSDSFILKEYILGGLPFEVRVMD